MSGSRFDRYLDNPNVRGLLTAIRHGEGTEGPAGYQTQFTGSTFDASRGWAHPREIKGSGGLRSDAAGAYQFLSTTWNEVAKQEGLGDFSPLNQDRAALALIARRGVSLDEVAKVGISPSIVDRLAPEWASLPTARTGTSYYGQGGKSYKELEQAYHRGRGGRKPAGGGAVAPVTRRGSGASGGTGDGGGGGGGEPAVASAPSFATRLAQQLLSAPSPAAAPAAASMASVPAAQAPLASGLSESWGQLLQPRIRAAQELPAQRLQGDEPQGGGPRWGDGSRRFAGQSLLELAGYA